MDACNVTSTFIGAETAHLCHRLCKLSEELDLRRSYHLIPFDHAESLVHARAFITENCVLYSEMAESEIFFVLFWQLLPVCWLCN